MADQPGPDEGRKGTAAVAVLGVGVASRVEGGRAHESRRRHDERPLGLEVLRIGAGRGQRHPARDDRVVDGADGERERHRRARRRGREQAHADRVEEREEILVGRTIQPLDDDLGEAREDLDQRGARVAVGPRPARPPRPRRRVTRDQPAQLCHHVLPCPRVNLRRVDHPPTPSVR